MRFKEIKHHLELFGLNDGLVQPLLPVIQQNAHIAPPGVQLLKLLVQLPSIGTLLGQILPRLVDVAQAPLLFLDSLLQVLTGGKVRGKKNEASKY